MAVGLIVAGALAGAALAAAANSPEILPSDYYKSNRESLDDLLARQKAGKLGLTGPEQVRLLQQQQVGMGANDVAARGAVNQAMQGSGAAFGAAPIAATAAQLGNRVLADQGREAIAEADRAAKRQQRAEIEARRALQEQRRVEQLDAAGAVATGGIKGAMMGSSMSPVMSGGPPPLAPPAPPPAPPPAATDVGLQRSADVQRLISAGVPAATAEQWATTMTPEQMTVMASLYQ